MSDGQIQIILAAIADLKEDVDLLKNKRLTIEEIGIGSLMGWIKLMVTVSLFFTVLAGSGYAITSQVDTLNTQFRSHVQYTHKLEPPK